MKHCAADLLSFQQKVVFSLISLVILLSLTISVFSPPFQYNPTKISESTSSFSSQFEATMSVMNNDSTITKTLDNSGKSETSSSPSTSPLAQNDPEELGDTSLITKTNNGKVKDQENCDLFSGEWIPNPEGPYYTNETCFRIQEYQNCMKHGKPEMDYLKWRWKPDGCELPIFDPNQFLELVRGKSIAFVGDSLARNHMQSLACLLSRVVFPEDVSSVENGDNQDWVYKDYNFNISVFWAPHLIRSERPEPEYVNLYLDEFDEHWTAKIEKYHYIIISAGHWFFYASKFYENGSLIGCHGCTQDNVTQLTPYFSYEKAWRTALRAINSLANSKAVIFLRTISPPHFEGGSWDDGGDCVRTRPFKRNETVLEGYYSMMRDIQLQELRNAQEEGSNKRGLRLRLFDVAQSMSLRPDGHPSKYSHWPTEKLSNDCLHWCLPGPVDAWNDLLLQLFKWEEPHI